ncbi:hypothetical protein SAMN05443247_06639 [Bradyrhizobium erythrophlei]|nr:hypothetical protein SAMN05443247_06639 [Bradyrhizobium erythrophlei]
MKTQTPEDTVAAAEAAVADWRAELAQIDASIAAAKDTIRIAKQQREQNTFLASTADARAMGIVEKAKEQQHEAEQRLADLVNQRWPAAWRSLQAAEQAEANAKRAAARPHIEAVKREVIAADVRIDKRNAENAADVELRKRLMLELQSYDTGDSGMVSRLEASVGLQRIANAMPLSLRALPAPTAKHVIPLAESDGQYLNLPPEPEKEKAA